MIVSPSRLWSPPTKVAASRALLLIAALALHGLIFFGLAGEAKTHPNHASNPIAMTTVFLRPVIREDDGRPIEIDLTQLTVPIDVQVASPVGPSSLDSSVPRNGSASLAVPTLIGDSVGGTGRFVKQAALLPGEGATVILRVQILESGEPGEIDIDVSSGSSQVDRAAIAYARVNRWYAGRVEGKPKAMWIRWGVRLQA